MREEQLRDIIQLSLGSTPEKMLEKALQACIEVSGATGGSILGEEGPYLQFLFSDIQKLIGMRVPFDSIAGVTVLKGVIIYTYAPGDRRHFEGIDEHIESKTEYLLSIPIPSIHQSAAEQHKRRNAGVLQLLFNRNIFPEIPADSIPQEFDIKAFRENELYEKHLKDIFWILPNVAFGLEVMNLRRTSHQAIHELKNKLISALSWLDYLKDDMRKVSPESLNNETVIEDMKLADSAMREGAELAKTYLAFTKIYEPHYVKTGINSVLKEVAASAAAYARERQAGNLRVTTSLAPDIPDKELDPAQLKMAFFNLCKNAVEALVDHRVENPVINMSSRLEGDSILVVIGDNGPGMPQEIADNLFIPFKTKKEGGTGLGLTITKKIIDIHDGQIRCRTGSDGTAFTITI